MIDLEMLISNIDDMLATRRKRQIVGGVLLSASLFLGGLAITALSIKDGGVL